ncbi:hypothetical protein [Rubritalea marina]|uniref:hypothetical protein n=1 Tax=Rubritalea marina TaxID=361055 RepID=UPI000364ADFC|nr:hypothetical protein [Rubritalea marina]
MSQSKSDIIQSILNTLQSDLDVLRRAALETHENSTDSQSQQEGKYDTRGLEASYLAEAQAAKVNLLEEQIGIIERLVLDLDDDAPIAPGAMCTISTDTDAYGYLLLPAGGGLRVEFQGMVFTVITPDSPIGSALLGEVIGADVKMPDGSDGFIDDIW